MSSKHSHKSGHHRKHPPAKKPRKKKKRTHWFWRLLWRLVLLFLALGFIGGGILFLTIASIRLPSIESIHERQAAASTKIYDRTGEILLFDVHEDVQRTFVPGESIARHVKNAMVAIEDDQFYEHPGIDVRGTLRGIIYTALSKANLRKGGIQGGSTITQQVIKNTLLTGEVRLKRKFKEWILALRLEQELSKDDILGLYLNEIPFGGNIYGIQDASKTFFDKNATDISLAESAYLAAIPNAPTYFSPYGNNRDKLEARKDLVLRRMYDLNFITQEEYDIAIAEEVEFQAAQNSGRAFHFVQFIREQLEERYGHNTVINGGLKVITTLDWELQEKAEEIVLRNALENEESFNASNAALVAIEAGTGQIITMVGSRDYLDSEIDGNFNVTLARRQPGSSFKPFVYATAFEKGLNPNTAIFDLRTQFTARDECGPDHLSSEDICYSPVNYDFQYKGPMNLRTALGQSRNVPAVKLLYLVGVSEAIRTATNMGIQTLTNPDQYGLTLVLGGGEVRLLDMTAAYSVFANEGIRHPAVGILRVEDQKGKVLEEFTSKPQPVIDRQAALQVTDVLADNVARTPLFGAHSFLYFGASTDVAGKTGTTNNKRDGWLIGYTTEVAVGAWVGNNDNTPMTKGSSVAGPLWRDFMDEVNKTYPPEKFSRPDPITNYYSLKPIVRGIWQGGETFTIDTVSGLLATEFTPEETRKDVILPEIHNILHWIDRKNINGPSPNNPHRDPQYSRWETQVQNWLLTSPEIPGVSNLQSKPTEYDNVHTGEGGPVVTITEPNSQTIYGKNNPIVAAITNTNGRPVAKVNYFINDTFIGSSEQAPHTFTFIPNNIDRIQPINTMRVVVFDDVFNQGEAQVEFMVQ